VVLVDVHLVRHGDLAEIRHALDGDCRLARLAQDREEDPDQDGDDADDDQQLNERERKDRALPPSACHGPLPGAGHRLLDILKE
jgi:hypothetical protein